MIFKINESLDILRGNYRKLEKNLKKLLKCIWAGLSTETFKQEVIKHNKNNTKEIIIN